MNAILHDRRAPAGVAGALICTTVVVAALDLVEVALFYSLTRDVAPLAIGQSIASGVLGAAAYRGGLPAALLGVVLHTAIMGAIVATYFGTARRVPPLRRHWIVGGIAFGLAVYAAMNGIVVPLSAAVVGPRDWDVVANGLFAHVVMVGLPTAGLVDRILRRGARR